MERRDPAEVRVPVSVIVLTRDEEANIGPCLGGLAWADEVIVVDSGSQDRTIDAALAARPDARWFVHPFRDFGDQRNWALDNTAPRNEWILFLDADERSTDRFRDAVRDAIADPGPAVGYFLTYRNLFLGTWLKRSTMYPSWQLRLLRHGRVRYRKEGHGQREVADGPLGYVREPYDHEAFSKGVAEWIGRHNRYSTDEVELVLRLRSEPLRLSQALSRDPTTRRRALKRVWARLPLRPFVNVFYRLVLKGGMLDGRAGVLYCLLRLAQEIHIETKLREQEYLLALAARRDAAATRPVRGAGGP